MYPDPTLLLAVTTLAPLAVPALACCVKAALAWSDRRSSSRRPASPLPAVAPAIASAA